MEAKERNDETIAMERYSTLMSTLSCAPFKSIWPLKSIRPFFLAAFRVPTSAKRVGWVRHGSRNIRIAVSKGSTVE